MRRELILPADQSAPLLARSALNEAIPPPFLNERAGDARLAISELAAMPSVTDSYDLIKTRSAWSSMPMTITSVSSWNKPPPPST
jgi:hypothetical protein